jgi:hypothetical protein
MILSSVSFLYSEYFLLQVLTLDFQELRNRRRCLLRGAFVKLPAGRVSLSSVSEGIWFRRWS